MIKNFFSENKESIEASIAVLLIAVALYAWILVSVYYVWPLYVGLVLGGYFVIADLSGEICLAIKGEKK